MGGLVERLTAGEVDVWRVLTSVEQARQVPPEEPCARGIGGQVGDGQDEPARPPRDAEHSRPDRPLVSVVEPGALQDPACLRGVGRPLPVCFDDVERKDTVPGDTLFREPGARGTQGRPQRFVRRQQSRQSRGDIGAVHGFAERKAHDEVVLVLKCQTPDGIPDVGLSVGERPRALAAAGHRDRQLFTPDGQGRPR